MKKGLKTLAVALVLSVGIFVSSGCSNKSSNKNALVGKWDYSGFVYTFEKDGTGNYDALGTIMNFTYEYDGNKLSILYDDATVPFDTEYRIEGNTLIIKDSLDEEVRYEKK